MRLIPARLEQQSAVPQFEMRLESTLAEIGVVPKLLTPKRQLLQQFENQWLITKYEVLNHRLPTNPRLTYGLKEVDPATTLHKTPPSQDPNADRLARVHGAQVVICVGALKCLFDNWPPNLTRSFEIPVTVRVFEGGRTVIFIDKPLPARGLTLTEKNEWFHKLTVKATCCHPWGHSGQIGKIDGHQVTTGPDGVPVEDDPFAADEDDATDLEDLETFGTAAVQRQQGLKVLLPQVDGLHDEGDGSDDSSEKLVIADDAKKSPEKSAACAESPKGKRGRTRRSESSQSETSLTTASKKSKLMAVLNKAQVASGGVARVRTRSMATEDPTAATVGCHFMPPPPPVRSGRKSPLRKKQAQPQAAASPATDSVSMSSPSDAEVEKILHSVRPPSVEAVEKEREAALTTAPCSLGQKELFGETTSSSESENSGGEDEEVI